ncbi:UNVERIFIED_CONTAM: hypothetical protein NCL1_38700 [Trichonephila clavipes]
MSHQEGVTRKVCKFLHMLTSTFNANDVCVKCVALRRMLSRNLQIRQYLCRYFCQENYLKFFFLYKRTGTLTQITRPFLKLWTFYFSPSF